MLNSSLKSQQSPNPAIQGFLESLRRQSAGSPQSPDLDPQFSAFERFQEKKRLEELRKAEFFQSRTKEFHEVYSLKKRQDEQRISQLHEQLIGLSRSMRKLKREVDVALKQNLPQKQAGKQHESFLDHLKHMLDLLKRQVESSQTWLHLYNQRSKKKAYYWANVQKSGSSFLNSGERVIATSVG